MGEITLRRERWGLVREGPAPGGLVIAVDPGMDAGGAVVMDDREVRGSVSWRRRRNKGRSYRVRCEGMNAEDVPTLILALSTIADHLTPTERRTALYVVERIVPMKGKMAGHTTLAEASGIALAYGQVLGARVAPTVGVCGTMIERPVAGRWRSEILRLGSRTRSREAAAVAVQAVQGREVTGSRRLIDLGVHGYMRDCDDEHVAEAVCIGLWASGYRLRRDGK